MTRQLLAAAARGSRAAQELLFAHHFDAVYVFLRMALADPDEAERTTVKALVTGIERRDECPAGDEDVEAWLRGIALEFVAARARAEGVHARERGTRRLNARRLERALRGVSDLQLGALVRALDPLTRQVVVLGLMSGVDDATVAAIAGVAPADVEALQAHGLAEIGVMLDRYHTETENIGQRAKEIASHLRPQRGPVSSGMIVVKGASAMVVEGPTSGFWHVAMRALDRIAELLLRRHHHHNNEPGPLDGDVGDVKRHGPLQRTPADRAFEQPRRTPSLAEYRTPKSTPGMGGYRVPKGTPSTERISSRSRALSSPAAAYSSQRKKY